MKSLLKALVFITLLTLIPFNTVMAESQEDISDNRRDIIMQIDEKRRLIGELQKSNTILEKQVDATSRQIDKLLTQLPKYTNISQKTIDKQFIPRFNNIMDQLTDISNIEKAYWKHLKAGNKKIATKNYSAGLVQLNRAAVVAEKKRNMLIKLNSNLEEFLKFLRQIEVK